MKFLGFDINIARKDVVQNDILDEKSLVVLLVIKIFDVCERNSQKF